jgi:hypothetical protein
MLFLSSLECEYLLAQHYHRAGILARIMDLVGAGLINCFLMAEWYHGGAIATEIKMEQDIVFIRTSSPKCDNI